MAELAATVEVAGVRRASDRLLYWALFLTLASNAALSLMAIYSLSSLKAASDQRRLESEIRTAVLQETERLREYTVVGDHGVKP